MAPERPGFIPSLALYHRARINASLLAVHVNTGMSIAMADTDKNAPMAASSPSPASPLEPRPLFQYAPLSAPDHIRLLRILAETSHTPDTVAVSLEEFALVDEAYECLSYTWDGPRNCDVGQQWTTNHKLILCNGCAAYIRQNLHDALVDLRTLGILGPIWIDALCINQEMLDERSSQVSMMARIYKGSTRVIVWLGKEDNYTKVALLFILLFRLFLLFFESSELGMFL